jgi:hypothetical protein
MIEQSGGNQTVLRRIGLRRRSLEVVTIGVAGVQRSTGWKQVDLEAAADLGAERIAPAARMCQVVHTGTGGIEDVWRHLQAVWSSASKGAGGWRQVQGAESSRSRAGSRSRRPPSQHLEPQVS